MKYLRKIAYMLLVLIFIGSVIVGIGVILAVKNVNINIESYSYPYSEWEQMPEDEKSAAASKVEEFRKVVYDKYHGKLIGFVDDAELAHCFDESGYIFESCKKIYPCTLEITVKERRETFAVPVGDGSYKTYDAIGEFLPDDNDEVNNLDGSPDVILSGGSSDEDVVKIARIGSDFSKYFSALRAVVSKIELHSSEGYLQFDLRCGIKIHLADYANLTENKIRKAYEKFSALGGEEKLSGTIVVSVRNADGEIVAERIPVVSD